MFFPQSIQLSHIETAVFGASLASCKILKWKIKIIFASFTAFVSVTAEHIGSGNIKVAKDENEIRYTIFFLFTDMPLYPSLLVTINSPRRAAKCTLDRPFTLCFYLLLSASSDGQVICYSVILRWIYYFSVYFCKIVETACCSVTYLKIVY